MLQGSSPLIRVCEFFAGIGLMRLGLERRQFAVAFANDLDPAKREMYVANFGERDFILGDIADVSARELPDAALWTASFPCNDLSLAGARAGLSGRHSGAFWQIIRLLEEARDRRPACVLLENVPGFLTSQGGRDCQRALAELGELGYSCDLCLLDAACFTPQSRLRLFVVASSAPPSGMKGLEASDIRPPKLVQFINDRPRLPWRLASWPTPPQDRPSLESILEDLPDDHEAWWNEARTSYFMNQLSQRHQALAATMIGAPRPRYATAFRRVRLGKSMAELRVDGLAGCLRTPRGGSGRQILLKAGRGRRQVRLLTPRECARLQGAPESFVIQTSLNRALFGFGDAVCVPAIAWIAEHGIEPAIAAANAVKSRRRSRPKAAIS